MNTARDNQHIVMNFTAAPSLEDIEIMAQEALATLPDALTENTEELALMVEDFPDETTQQDLELESEFDLLALYKSSKEILPGVMSKVANEADQLTLYRRPIIDAWAESGDDLASLITHTMIVEIAQASGLEDDEIDEIMETL